MLDLGHFQTDRLFSLLGSVSFHPQKHPSELKCITKNHMITVTLLNVHLYLDWEQRNKQRQEESPEEAPKYQKSSILCCYTNRSGLNSLFNWLQVAYNFTPQHPNTQGTPGYFYHLAQICRLNLVVRSGRGQITIPPQTSC